MGLHAGEASTSAAGLVGIDVNRAARIAAAAHGGQVVVSDAVRSLVVADLDAGVSLRGLGNHRLKDLREPQPPSQVVADGLLGVPPLRSLDARPNNLPTQLTSFVGRGRGLAEAGELLERAAWSRSPAGGTGKTRLSLQVAANAAERYPDGVFFIASRRSRARARRIQDRLGDRARGERQPDGRCRAPRVARRQAGPRGPRQLRAGRGRRTRRRRPPPRRPGAVRAHHLRAALRVSGEQEYPVPGCRRRRICPSSGSLELASLPAAERTVDAEALSAYESVKLVHRAGDRDAAGLPDHERERARWRRSSRASMDAPGHRAGGGPRRLFSPEALRARLEDQLALLSAGARDLPERQQTLRGAIAWSYDLLDAGSGCSSIGCRSSRAGRPGRCRGVCGPGSELGMEVVDGLVALAEQSLIRTIDSQGEPRFQVLGRFVPTARNRLASRSETAAVADRHAAWFLALAERIAPELAGGEQRQRLDQLELEHDNIRAVLDRATAAGDARVAIGLALAVWRFWQKRGHLYEARKRLTRWRQPPWSRDEPRLRAPLEALGGVCWWQADIRAMKVAYLEAVELCRALGDKTERGTPSTTTPSSSAFQTSQGARSVTRTRTRRAGGRWRRPGPVRGARRRPRVANVRWGIGNKKYFEPRCRLRRRGLSGRAGGFPPWATGRWRPGPAHGRRRAAPGPRIGRRLDLTSDTPFATSTMPATPPGSPSCSTTSRHRRSRTTTRWWRGCGAPRGR